MYEFELVNLLQEEGGGKWKNTSLFVGSET